MEALWRVSASAVGRERVSEARSMRMTEAPASARSMPAKGPGARPANSRTVMPVRGGGPISAMLGGVDEVLGGREWMGPWMCGWLKAGGG